MVDQDREWYSFEEAVQLNHAFEQLLKSHGIEITQGSALERMSLNVFEVYARHLKQIESAEDFDPRACFIEAMGLSDLTRKLLRVRHHPQFKTLVPHLHLLNRGEILQNAPIKHFDDAANKIFELLLCACIMSFRSEVLLDDPDKAKGNNPDILIGAPGKQIGIACKTLLSSNVKTLFDNVEKAVDQIEKSPASRGFVFISLKNVMNHEKYWRIVDSPDGISGVEPVFTCFSEPRYAFGEIMKDASDWSQQCIDEIQASDWIALFQNKKACPCVVFMLQTSCTVRMYQLSQHLLAAIDMPIPTTLGTLSIMPIGQGLDESDMGLLRKINFAFHNQQAK